MPKVRLWMGTNRTADDSANPAFEWREILLWCKKIKVWYKQRMPLKSSKLSPNAFDRIVKRAFARIPGEIREGLENVLISVQQRPSPELLDEMGLPQDELLLGVYQGTPLGERTVSEPPLYPDVILLFQEPLEAVCETIEEMEREIEITVVHEVAHFLGIGEERLAELGYG